MRESTNVISIKVVEEAKQLIEAVMDSYNSTPRNSAWMNNLAEIDLVALEPARRILKGAPELQALVFISSLRILVDNRRDGSPQWAMNSRKQDVLRQVVIKLSKKAVPLSTNELAFMIESAGRLCGSTYELPGTGLLSIVEKALGTQKPDESLKAALTGYKKTLKRERHSAEYTSEAEAKKLVRRIEILLSSDDETDTKLVIEPGEAWGDQAIKDIAMASPAERSAWRRLLQYYSVGASGTKPSGKWLKQANALIAPLGEATFIKYATSWLSLMPQKGTRTEVSLNYGFDPDPSEVICATNTELLKGLAWSCVSHKDPALVTALGDAAEASFKKVKNLGPRCPKLGNACIHTLSEMNTKDAIAQISRVQSRAKHASSRTQIEKAIGNAAEQAGMSIDDLQDLGVPDFGMTEPGIITKLFGQWTARLVLNRNGAETTWIHTSGKEQQGIPVVLKKDFADELKSLKKLESELEKLLPTIGSRIEKSYLDQRHWQFEAWRERYLNHPVCSVFARKLVWSINGKAGIWSGDKIADIDGMAIAPENTAIVELWHPIAADPATVLRWRRKLAEQKIVQPFKQCHREIYVLTDAERETSTYSNRFAGHLIRQHQLQHVCMSRGWTYQLMGSFDFQSVPTLQLPRWNMAVEYYMETSDNGDEETVGGIYRYVATDQVKFLRESQTPVELPPQMQALADLLKGLPTRATKMKKMLNVQKQYEAVPLTEILPVVFSEVMRDVDLFVSVCSIGADPNGGGYGHVWHNAAFGELTKSAETRRDVLADLLPVLKIAPRCHIAGKFLHVQGDIRTYKIHLGTGNIMMEPNDEYLCIVASRGKLESKGKVFLPFEGDHLISIILSKAFLLAEDTKITDASIINQIRRKM